MAAIKQLTPGGARYQLRRWWERYQGWRLRGTTYVCPCCGGSFRAMLPAGLARRSNARCPRCSSLERHRLIWLYLTRQTNFLSTPLRVLDVAPEEFLQRKLHQLKNLDYLSIDLESGMAMRRMDVTQLEFPDDQFDVIFCNHVFEHIPDDAAAMRELYRVLKPNGFAILQTPIDRQRPTTDEDPNITDQQERIRRFGQADHVRVYGLDFFERLRVAGWRVTDDAFVDTIASSDVKRFGLIPGERLIIGRK